MMLRKYHQQSETDEELIRDYRGYDPKNTGLIKLKNVEEVLR